MSNMKICPIPMRWNEIYQQLIAYSAVHPCAPPTPPIPLILNGWVFSSDVEKLRQWEATIEWALLNGCGNLVANLPDELFYWVEVPSYPTPPCEFWYDGRDINPCQNSQLVKPIPSAERLLAALNILDKRWPEIVGEDLRNCTKPLKFKGKKGRRLSVAADYRVRPAWGNWTQLPPEPSRRRAFSALRAAINKAISPHEVDHIDFVCDNVVSWDTTGVR